MADILQTVFADALSVCTYFGGNNVILDIYPKPWEKRSWTDLATIAIPHTLTADRTPSTTVEGQCYMVV